MQLVGIDSGSGSRETLEVPSPRLVSAAHEFEGQMMKELLKPVTNGDAVTGIDDVDDSSAGSGSALGEFATETLGQALSQQGGFGIANRIIQQLSHSGNRSVTRNPDPKTGSESFSMTKVMRRI